MGSKQKKSSGGKKQKRASNKNKNSATDPDAAGSIGGSNISNGLILVDPARCRFQHSRIRPFFSGCGRSVHETLKDIREGNTKVSDLPPIQVLVGNESNGNGDDNDNDDKGPWYFSLNNRRLWVLKRLREEGFLERTGNKVAVRVRQPKSQQEKERYTLANCALEARFVPEQKKKPPKQKNGTQQGHEQEQGQPRNPSQTQDLPSKHKFAETDGDGDGDGHDTEDDGDGGDDNDGSDDDDDDDGDSRAIVTTTNRFANIMMENSSSSDSDD